MIAKDPSKTARGAARSAASSNLNRVRWWPRSIGFQWFCQHGFGLEVKEARHPSVHRHRTHYTHLCESTIRYAAENGYEVTVVKDAVADYSDEEMHAALDINIPNYANAVVTTNEVIESISSL